MGNIGSSDKRQAARAFLTPRSDERHAVDAANDASEGHPPASKGLDASAPSIDHKPASDGPSLPQLTEPQTAPAVSTGYTLPPVELSADAEVPAPTEDASITRQAAANGSATESDATPAPAPVASSTPLQPTSNEEIAVLADYVPLTQEGAVGESKEESEHAVLDSTAAPLTTTAAAAAAVKSSQSTADVTSPSHQAGMAHVPRLESSSADPAIATSALPSSTEAGAHLSTAEEVPRVEVAALSTPIPTDASQVPASIPLNPAASSLLPTNVAPLASTPMIEVEPVLPQEPSATSSSAQPTQSDPIEQQADLDSRPESEDELELEREPEELQLPTEPAAWGIPLTEPPPPLTVERIAALSVHNRGAADADSQYAETDTDSALGDMSYASSMTSVTSSIYESVAEHGRTYHSYKHGKYMLPNDLKEQSRLDTQHYLLCEAIGGRLFLAPIKEHRVNRVLDIATGTGIWAMEFADDFPNAEVIGTDLTPIQPRWCPPNCHFEVDDAEDEWVFSQPFSYIHGRALLSCFEDPREVIFKAVANLEPGGWLEFQDASIPFEYDPPNVPPPFEAFDGKEPECVIQRWEKLTIEASITGGRSWTNVQYYKKWFEEAGLVDVVEHTTKLPIGVWDGLTKRERKMGLMHFPNIYHGLEGMTLRNFARLGWTFDQSKELVEEVRQELLKRRYKPFNRSVVVMGRKPEVGELVSPQSDCS